MIGKKERMLGLQENDYSQLAESPNGGRQDAMLVERMAGILLLSYEEE